MPKQGETTTKFRVDISELKKNIADAQRQIRLANAEFKAAAAGMDNWQTSSNGLTAKLTQLRSVLTSQKSVLDKLKKEYELVAKEQGANSKGAQELAIRIKNQEAAVNKTEHSLNSYEKELKDVEQAEKLAAKNGKTVEENLKELGDTAEETGKDVQKSSEGFTVMKGALANLAAQGIQVALSAMKDLAKETWESVKAAAAYSDEINTLSIQTGISAEKLQEFKYMEDLIDVSTDTMTGSMAKLIKNMANAQNGSKNTTAAFEALGVAITDESGELRNNQDVFGEVIDALGKMENETQRDAYAMQIFGKSAQDLNPLIEAGGDKIAALAQEAHDMGYVLSGETLESLNETQDALDRFSKVTEGVKNNLVAAFGPTVTATIEPLVEVLKDIPAAVSSGDFSGVLESTKGIIDGAIQTAQEQAPQFIKTGLSLARQVAVGLIQELPSIQEASLGIIQSAIEGITEESPKLIEAAPPVLEQLASGLIKAAPGLLSAANGLIVTLGKSLIKTAPVLLSYLPGLISLISGGIQSLAPELLNGGVELILAIIDGFQQCLPLFLALLPLLIDQAGTLLEEGLPLIITAATTLFNGIIEALPGIIQLLIRELPGLVTAATNLLVKSTPLLVEAATTMLKGIVQALPTIIRLMVADLPYLINAITMTLVANTPLILSAAITMLTAVVSAIPEICIELAKQVPSIVSTVYDGIMEGVGSMIEAGKSLIAGVWDGISASGDWFKGKIAEWVGNITDYFKDLFDIHSPSGLMRDMIGKNLVLGLADGITDNVNEVKDAMRGLMQVTTGAALDMTDVKVHAASGMIPAETSGAMTGGIVQNTYNTFNQTNNSPKALSRLEIYRQTRNQFAFATGG